MPHLTLEYTSNLPGFDPAVALKTLNQALAASGQFEELDIKSRATALASFAVGTAEVPRGFVHAKLYILSGRTPETKKALSHCTLQALRTVCPAPPGVHVQLCAEILDIDRDSYAKASWGP